LNSVTIGNREFYIENSIEETLQFTSDNHYHCYLSHYVIIDVIGEKAKTYLQGQLTNDILNLNDNTLSKQLLCNIKGQIIAKIWALEIKHQLRLIVQRDLWPEVHHLLEKTATLSRVAFQENKILKLYGILSNQPMPNTFKLNEIQRLMLCDDTPLLKGSTQKPDLFWHYISIQQGEFHIYPSTCRLYLPKPLGLETEWIHFNKGCYRGQEIIARMHFLGKDKYKLQSLEMNWDFETKPNLQLIDFCPINETQAIGLILIKKGE
jgi:tRNA-modifying protein YgfZ